jgi:protein O-mannosyl-transferase
MRGKPLFSASRWTTVLAGGVIVLAALAAYRNSLSVPFVFDDASSITDNRTIRHLWPIWDALSPPRGGEPVSGRPLVNLSLAANYALGGTAVRGYHALNLAIHILAGLTLFGVVRRTLLQPALRGRFGSAAVPLALAVAVIWTVHPLQTESVTYVIQRAESLMGLFYLLTVYCFIRGMESRAPGRWHALSVAACLLGMASKEVMVSAPLMVLLYDRTFIAGSFREAWTRRWRLYLALAGTWLLLGYLVVGAANRGGTAGLGFRLSGWAYALTQCWAIVHYLWLSVWPSPLVFDYGTYVVRNAVAVVPCALILLPLVWGTVTALRRWPAFGFAGFWFFAILAPSSSVIPVVTQTVAEHRMYLPLAAVVVLVVIGIHALAGRRSMVVFVTLAVGLGWLTSRRNQDYRSELAIWIDTVAKRPDNPRAHCLLGNVLLQMGRLSEAMEQYEQALRLKPDDADAHNNFGTALLRVGKVTEGIAQYGEALRIKPGYVEAHYNLANALSQVGKVAEALGQYEEALRFKPDHAPSHLNLGNALVQVGRVPEAIEHYEQVLRIDPDIAEAHYNLGNVLLQMGKVSEAKVQCEQALRLKPNYAEAHNNLGIALFQLGRVPEAKEQFVEALRLKPDYAAARSNLLRLQSVQQAVNPKN